MWEDMRILCMWEDVTKLHERWPLTSIYCNICLHCGFSDRLVITEYVGMQVSLYQCVRRVGGGDPSVIFEFHLLFYFNATCCLHLFGYLSNYCLTGCTLDLCIRSLILLKWSLISCFYHFFQEIITNFRLWKIFPSVFAFQSTPELMFGLYLLYYFRVFERQIGSNKYSVGTLPFVIISSLGQNFK